MTNYTAQEQDIPEIEEDEHDQDHIDDCYLITHHNTHWESERIRQEYKGRLQDLNDQQYFEQVDRASELQYYLPQVPYDEPQVETIQATHQSTTQRTTEELRQLFGRGRGKTRQDKLHNHRPYRACTRSLQSRIQRKIKKNQKLR